VTSEDAAADAPAAVVDLKLYVWVMVKLLETVSGGRESTMTWCLSQVDLFLC
jgi:hypothetical protein